MRTLRDAESAIRKRFKSEGGSISLRYDRAKVIETDRWWYIPCSWIGCSGQIVDKRDLYVNWLGSALSLEDCFWGHDHGIVCGPVDFTFTAEIKPHWDTVFDLLLRFQRPVAKPDKFGQTYEWYPDEEVREAIIAQFPTFRAHFVWFAIPELRAAVESRSVSFYATRA